jgi:restriction endonuclease S subunit
MQLRLQDIADIRVGATMRGKDASRKTEEAGLPLLRISDLTPDGRIELGESPHLVGEGSFKAQFRVRPDDILVANRGVRLTAAIAPKGLEAFIGGQLFFVRVKRHNISSQFIHWFLSLASTQHSLLSQMRGTYVQNLSIKSLRELEIPAPASELQEKVVALARLGDKERSLLRRIEKKRALFTEAALKRAVLKNTPPSSQN